MDQALQEAKRRAQLNPQDSATLWDYIRRLERSQAHIDDSPLYAILTDGETIGSPCRYSSGTAVPYKDGDDKITLYGRWMDDYTSDDPNEFYPGIDRAWIITESIRDAGIKIWEDAECGNDSTGDAVTSAVLSFYKNNAVKTVRFPEMTDEELDEDGTLSDDLLEKIHASYEAYRASKDGGRVRVSIGRDLGIMDLLLGAWCNEDVRTCMAKPVSEQKLETLPHPPHQLLVQKLDKTPPFKAILYKQKHGSYTTGVAYFLLCDSCEHKPTFRCSKMPDAEFSHQTEHRLDDHVILEIDGHPVADVEELYKWL